MFFLPFTWFYLVLRGKVNIAACILFSTNNKFKSLLNSSHLNPIEYLRIEKSNSYYDIKSMGYR